MSEQNIFYRIVRLENQWKDVAEDGKSAVISSTLVLYAEHAATLFISQEIDGIEMFEAARYSVEKGENRLVLKDLKIVKPRKTTANGEIFSYQTGVRVFAAGLDEVIAGNAMSLS